MTNVFVHAGEARSVKAITDIPGFLREPGTGTMISLADLGTIARSSVWAYRCVKRRSEMLAGIPLKLYRGDGDDAEEIDDHPLLSDTALGSGITERLAMLEADLCVYGKSYLVWDKGYTGGILKLTRLNPIAVTPKFDAQDRTQLLGYEYRPNGGLMTQGRVYAPDEIVALSTLDWANDYGGLSPTAVAALAANADKNMMAQVEAFFKNGALLSGMLTTDQQMQEGEIERLRSAWRRTYQGVRNWFQTFFAWGGVKFIPMQPEPKNLAMAELQEEVRTNICAAYGLSPALILTNAKYSNSVEARKSAYYETILPECDFVADSLNRQLVHPLYGDDLHFEFDYSEIEALREDQNVLYQRASSALSTGATFGEVMEMIGLEPPDDAEMAARRFIPSNLVQLTDKATMDADAERAEQAKQDALAKLNAPKPEAETETEPEADAGTMPQDRAQALADVRQGKSVTLWGKACSTPGQVRAQFDAHWPKASPLAQAVRELQRFNDMAAAHE